MSVTRTKMYLFASAAVTAMTERKPEHFNHGKPWLYTMEEELERLIEKGHDAKEISLIMGRTPNAVCCKAIRLRLVSENRIHNPENGFFAVFTEHVPLKLRATLAESSAEQPSADAEQPVKEETKMSLSRTIITNKFAAVKIENRVFIDGLPSTDYTFEDLIEKVHAQKANIAHLEKMVERDVSVAIKERITELQQGLKNLLQVIDELFAKNVTVEAISGNAGSDIRCSVTTVEPA